MLNVLETIPVTKLHTYITIAQNHMGIGIIFGFISIIIACIGAYFLNPDDIKDTPTATTTAITGIIMFVIALCISLPNLFSTRVPIESQMSHNITAIKYEKKRLPSDNQYHKLHDRWLIAQQTHFDNKHKKDIKAPWIKYKFTKISFNTTIFAFQDK